MLITLDFETFYGPDYTLSKMRTTDYIEDARFHAHGVGVKLNDAPAYWVSDADDIAKTLGDLPWSSAFLLCHNALFDASILAHHYGLIPRFYLDTQSMGRALYGAFCGASLNGLCEYLGLGSKIAGELIKTYGVERLDPAASAALGGYCVQDVELTYKLFAALREGFPSRELSVIDVMIRMATQPRLRLNAAKLYGALAEERSRKALAVENAGASLTVLRSRPKFAAALKALGVEPPVKVSARTGEETLAAAKDDDAFTALLEHPDERVVRLVSGRLACSSSIMETRLESLARTAARGPLPVHLSYWGASTGRASGGNRDNLQNLPRGSALREAIEAPPGETLVVCDLSSIEARGLAWLAGDTEMLDVFRSGGDPYCVMASAVYGRPITKADKAERFVGKILVLALGYGMSWLRLEQTLRKGVMGPPVVFTADDAAAMSAPPCPGLDNDTLAKCPPTLPMDAWLTHVSVCMHLVKLYRNLRYPVRQLWQDADGCLSALSAGIDTTLGAPGLSVGGGALWLPDGMPIHYPNMRRSESGEWVYDSFDGKVKGFQTHRIYGAKCVENAVQGIAAAILREQTVECLRAGLRPLLQVHDELVFSVPVAEADAARRTVQAIMSTAPAWAAGFPVSAEAGVGANYKDAKV